MINDLKNSPVGSLTKTFDGNLAFAPNPLPRELLLPTALSRELDRATLAVGTLAGAGEVLPNPHLLVVPFLRREAVLSSRIEGTQASISDVFEFEAAGERAEKGDVREVVNYVRAMDHGLERLKTLPISIRMTNELHERLMLGVRGQDMRPGELRQDQNWIGSSGTPIESARFVPPPPRLVPDLLAEWERFVNDDLVMPVLVKCALMHYQFEAIHPYLDGNGRIGRLLITLFLCQEEVLPTPLLYLSGYFERHRDEYIDHLFQVSATGRWDPWLGFFLRGVADQARDALRRSRAVRELHDQYRERLQGAKASANVMRLLDLLFVNPYVTVPNAARLLGVTTPGARGIVNRLVEAGLIELHEGLWPRIYVARELLRLIEAPTAPHS